MNTNIINVEKLAGRNGLWLDFFFYANNQTGCRWIVGWRQRWVWQIFSILWGKLQKGEFCRSAESLDGWVADKQFGVDGILNEGLSRESGTLIQEQIWSSSLQQKRNLERATRRKARWGFQLRNNSGKLVTGSAWMRLALVPHWEREPSGISLLNSF